MLRDSGFPAFVPLFRPSCQRAMRKPGSDGLSEEESFRREIQIGYDGSIVNDGDFVYILDVVAFGENPVQEIDYFHGLVAGVPLAQMVDGSEISASDMIGLQNGFTAIRMRNFQRRWKERRDFQRRQKKRRRI